MLLRWPRAHLLQSYGSGEVQARSGWTVHRLEVEVEGRPELPVTVLAASAAPLLPPRLYVPKGPACAAGDGPAWRAVLGALTGLARDLGASVVELEPNLWADDLPGLRTVLGAGWSPSRPRQPAHTALVDLSGGEEAVLARMRPKGRYNVRLAARRGVVTRVLAGIEEAAATLGRLCAATAARQRATLPGADHIRRTLEAVPGARVCVAEVEGEIVAGLLLAAFGQEAVYLYGGSTERHRDRQPSAALQAFAMREAIAAGCTTYDLWGIPPDADPSHPWHGLRQFKLNLGGVERTSAGALSLARRPVAARAVRLADATRERLRRVRHARSRGRLDPGTSPVKSPARRRMNAL